MRASEKNSVSPSWPMRHLQAHALHYFPEWVDRQVHVQLVEEQIYSNSKFYRICVSADNEQKVVLAKVSIPTSGKESNGSCSDNRPRISPLPDPDLKLIWQYEALAAIHQSIGSLRDPRFGTVRVLDCIPNQQAIIMEEVRALTLRKLFLKASRLHLFAQSVDIDPAFQNAGAWLRAYHSIVKQNCLEALQSHREDFIQAVHMFADFLSRRLGAKHYFNRVASLTVNRALNILPETLPVGLRHGDFALRNILIGPNNSVTGIDTLSKWQSAIYEDIAYFFVSLKTVKVQVLSLGLAFSNQKLGGYKTEFLNGYFNGEPVPHQKIRLFEILVLLEKWCSKIATYDDRLAENSILVRTPLLMLMNGFFRRTIDGLLDDLDKLPSDG